VSPKGRVSSPTSDEQGGDELDSFLRRRIVGESRNTLVRVVLQRGSRRRAERRRAERPPIEQSGLDHPLRRGWAANRIQDGSRPPPSPFPASVFEKRDGVEPLASALADQRRNDGIPRDRQRRDDVLQPPSGRTPPLEETRVEVDADSPRFGVDGDTVYSDERERKNEEEPVRRVRSALERRRDGPARRVGPNAAP
jgi:hypothetical protein